MYVFDALSTTVQALPKNLLKVALRLALKQIAHLQSVSTEK